MNQPGRQQRRDPPAWLAQLDPWARSFLAALRADPWGWHGRTVVSGRGDQAADDGYGLTAWERAAQRSVYWNLNHAASSGAKIRPEWSLEVSWLAPADRRGERSRLLLARVMPREAGRAWYADGPGRAR